MNRADGKRLGVLGGGVIGLTTALLAQLRGFRVTIYAEQPSNATTSFRAAASFKPVEVVYDAVTHGMLLLSHEHLCRIVAEYDASESGVWRHIHWEAASVPLEAPAYLTVMEGAEGFVRPEVPGGYAFGWRYRTFFMDASVYIPWLLERFLTRGGEVKPGTRLESLDRVLELPQELLANCTGLGAKRLFGDEEMQGIKGQVVVVERVAGMDWSISADGFYVYPRLNDMILGGTKEPDVYDERVDPGVPDLLVRGNRRILPQLGQAQVRGTYAGLRPFRRTGIRLEVQDVGGKRIVHNYGHGGAGITLAWGSAEQALAALEG